MIDEKKLIEDLEKRVNPNNPKDICYVTNIKRIIKDQPKIGEWIECKKSMPNIGTYVLLFTKDKCIAIGKYCWGVEEWEMCGMWVALDYVIYWQPLPELPEPYSD